MIELDIILISLTDAQKAELETFFTAVRKANAVGDVAPSIGAQIYEDGMVVRLFNAEQATALRVALGGKRQGPTAASAKERMEQTT
jgi:hypothetical protein